MRRSLNSIIRVRARTFAIRFRNKWTITSCTRDEEDGAPRDLFLSSKHNGIRFNAVLKTVQLKLSKKIKKKIQIKKTRYYNMFNEQKVLRI